jgi:transposase-like protein
MSTMAERTSKRSRRSFTDEFKASAIRLVLDEGQTVAAAARDVGLTESALRNWVGSDPREDRADDRRARRVRELGNGC